MSGLQPAIAGHSGSLLGAAGNIFGGCFFFKRKTAYEIQRAVGGKAHDEALQRAVEEGKTHFHQCSRCGRWVCPEVCWNAAAGQCEGCAPDFKEELASAHAQAKADAARTQLYEKAQATDYTSGVDMSADASVKAPTPAEQQKATAAPTCASCGAEVGKPKLCPECGAPTAPPRLTCTGCGHQPEGTPKFCPECGAKISVTS